MCTFFFFLSVFPSLLEVIWTVCVLGVYNLQVSYVITFILRRCWLFRLTFKKSEYFLAGTLMT